jgi:AGZA family xanthine/uracil permease-like MFS transporter
MKKASWFVPGDIDGFFGLMVDNLIQLLVLIGLCQYVCGFPPEFVYGTILPGVAISLLFGNIFYSWQASNVAEREERDDVTALPYGINTVSLFAFIFFVMLPVYMSTKDYKMAWKVGLLASFLSGLIEFFGSFVAETIRKITPRAALLSALSGIAITFISMDFLIRTYHNPLVAFIPLGIILVQYFGKIVFPFKIPGGLLAVIAGTILAWMSGSWSDKPMMSSAMVSSSISHFGFYFPVFSILDLVSVLNTEHIAHYAAVIIPMGITNVIGSLQNIESAEAAGDKFETRTSLLVNGAGTILGSFLGSPFPTTIYIGHPGWKGLGARIGYSVMNGAFMTIVCLFGIMGLISAIVPVEAGMPILLWIGIIIGAQAFEATPQRHAPAIILGLFPAIAGWGVLILQSAMRYANGVLQGAIAGKDGIAPVAIELGKLGPSDLPFAVDGMISLSQGFLLTSMIWAAICVGILDRNFQKAAYWAIAGSVLSFVGLIHAYSLATNEILNKYTIPAASNFGVAYLLLAALFLIVHFSKKPVAIESE